MSAGNVSLAVTGSARGIQSALRNAEAAMAAVRLLSEDELQLALFLRQTRKMLDAGEPIPVYVIAVLVSSLEALQ